MMKLNHLNLVVTDVAAAIRFFEDYFGFTCSEVKGDNLIAILRNDDDFTLVVMTSKEEQAYPKAFHLGFMQETEAEVRAVYDQLKAGGIPVGQEPRSIRGGYGFYFYFDGIMIEVGLAES